MGCGESKHAVATTESVSTKNKSNSRSSSSSRSKHGGDDHQPTTVKSKSTSTTSSMAPSRSASKADRLDAAEVIESAVDEKVKERLVDNMEAKETNVIGDRGKDKVGDRAKEKGNEVAHDRTASRESQSEYLSNQSEYDTPLHDGVMEVGDMVIKKMVDGREVRNVDEKAVDNKAVKETTVNDDQGDDKVGDQAKKKGNEAGLERTVAGESQNEYSSHKSEYENLFHEGAMERSNLVNKKPKVEEGTGEKEENEIVMIIQEKKEEATKGKTDEANEVEGLKESIPGKPIDVTPTIEILAPNQPRIEENVISEQPADEIIREVAIIREKRDIEVPAKTEEIAMPGEKPAEAEETTVTTITAEVASAETAAILDKEKFARKQLTEAEENSMISEKPTVAEGLAVKTVIT